MSGRIETGMKTGYQGTFVVAWTQTEVDGVENAPVDSLCVGASWRYSGEVVQVDGPRDLLILTDAQGETERRQSAARKVRKLLGAAVSGQPIASIEAGDDLPDQSFTVTNGFDAFVITVVDLPDNSARLLMFAGRVPPAQTDLWIVDRTVDVRPAVRNASDLGVICFTPATMIDTPTGKRRVDALRPGDKVTTQDDGPQELLWIGSRQMTGARLYAMPALRPVRIRAGAYGIGRPDDDLIVSPHHRMVLRGAASEALFNTPEVLVRACDLVNGGSVRVDDRLAQTQYIHLMFERHQVIRANGFETESFHPGAAALDMIPSAQRDALWSAFPELVDDPMRYGSHARRTLSASEAAILLHRLAA